MTDILLWGHSFEDYKKMFNLSEAELKLSILDCCGGPSSFNAALTKQGGQVISTDSLFALPKSQLAQKIEMVFSEMLENVKAHQQRFNWNEIATPEELATIRHKNIDIFLKDFDKGLQEERYLSDMPPNLPFKHEQFDLALCSHYLFANSENQSVDYHIEVIKNLCFVAKEVRIFPLLNSKGEIPDIVGPVTQATHKADLGVEIKAVPYQFQSKGNAMLRVWSKTCDVVCEIP